MMEVFFSWLDFHASLLVLCFPCHTFSVVIHLQKMKQELAIE